MIRKNAINDAIRKLQPRIPCDHQYAEEGRPVLITGGLGFIGCNLAAHYAAQRQRVHIFDNQSRTGIEKNLHWLKSTFSDMIEFTCADVLDRETLRDAVADAERVYHLAAQVAVTTSLTDPQLDFEVNAVGTLNVLEACRRLRTPPPLLYTSTNKVYGGLGDLRLQQQEDSYYPVAIDLRSGINESSPINFHSPYGCSKGAADQYVQDYARCFGLPSVVFRMSCIYGPHQFGTEDQGWVAHFVRTVLKRQRLSIYGDGYQVRDLLYVDDLMQAMQVAVDRIAVTRGRVFNIGGGPQNAVSVLQVIKQLELLSRMQVPLQFSDWRQADQLFYVSDISSFQQATGWRPQVGVNEGIELLYRWLAANSDNELAPSIYEAANTAGLLE